MAFSSAQYLKSVLQLLPQGRAWLKEPSALTYQSADALAQELARIDARAVTLLRESDPRTTAELISDWERICGLPDECSPLSSTLQGRRNQVLSILTSQGSLNSKFYIDFAEFLGFDVTVYEYRQFRTGLSRAGDPLSNGDWVYVFE